MTPVGKPLKRKANNQLLWKVCGMRDRENMAEVADLKPDFMGFIFYPRSPRYTVTIPNSTALEGLDRVGVFVDADVDEVAKLVLRFSLNVVQLHGNESPSYCKSVGKLGVRVMKAIRIREAGDFVETDQYTGVVDAFLFDTKGNAYGGNGKQFDWLLLQHYTGSTPYFLSGGIGPEDAPGIARLNDDRMVGIDVNSGFEVEPGIKNPATLKQFINELTALQS